MGIHHLLSSCAYNASSAVRIFKHFLERAHTDTSRRDRDPCSISTPSIRPLKSSIHDVTVPSIYSGRQFYTFSTFKTIIYYNK